MPVGLFALVAVGVHAAADVLDDKLLVAIDALDAWADGLLARSDVTAGWVDRVGPLQRTYIARALAVAWELAVDLLVVLPQLGYAEADEARLSLADHGWRAAFSRLNQRPTPARLIRPAVTAAFVGAGTYAIARLVESTLFLALSAEVASPAASEVIARAFSVTAVLVVLVSLGGRAVLRALQHADRACEVAMRASAPVWSLGLWGNVLSVPLALALVLEAQALLALVR